jgi:hypothetical protein
LSDQSEQKNSQRNFVSDQSVFDAMVAPGVDVQLGYVCDDGVFPSLINPYFTTGKYEMESNGTLAAT